MTSQIMFEKCLYFNTIALARVLDREWTKTFKPFNLTPSQAFVLRAVLNQPGQRQSDFAELLVISRSTATRLFDGLEIKKLIERRASNNNDAREQSIYPTSNAINLHQEINLASAAVTKRLKLLLGQDNFTSIVNQIKNIWEELK